MEEIYLSEDCTNIPNCGTDSLNIFCSTKNCLRVQPMKYTNSNIVNSFFDPNKYSNYEDAIKNYDSAQNLLRYRLYIYYTIL